MNVSDMTPWARGVLTYEQSRMLHWHVCSLRLHVTGMHPGKSSLYRVWLTDRHGTRVGLSEDVPGGRLFATISALLAEAGDPLPETDPWASLEQVMP